MDNFYPPEFFEEGDYGIMGIAQGSIPDEMWDNSILRALEYTGFNLQKLKDNGWLYVNEYISGSLKTNAPDVLSNIHYGETPNGDETVSDPSTPTGKAPNISYFEQKGLVCASFVAYYVCNYLPNIEGVDTSGIYAKVKEVGSNTMRSVPIWRTALTNLSTNGSGLVTKYTSASEGWANCVPGDVIAFKNSSGEWMHVAIYAGEYTLKRKNGSTIGNYHFIVHVGNDRGPEISTAEYMANAGVKSSSAAEWYHLNIDTQKGDLQIIKTSDLRQSIVLALLEAIPHFPLGEEPEEDSEE